MSGKKNLGQELAKKVVDTMFNNDPFSKWLGIERLSDAPGSSVLQLRVRAEMLNGFGIAHGGITYSLADSALAFAANGYGEMAVSVETSISHTAQVREGDLLTTQVEQISLTKRFGVYNISILNQEQQLVASFKGTVYRTGRLWFAEATVEN
jgi:acyl-CoA thioesterase